MELKSLRHQSPMVPLTMRLVSKMKPMSRLQKLISLLDVDVQFRDLSFWGQPLSLSLHPSPSPHLPTRVTSLFVGIVPKTRIPTVGSTIRDLFLFGRRPKQRIDILKNLTGRIAPKKMTLVMGPPGCGLLPSPLSLYSLNRRQVKFAEGISWPASHWEQQIGRCHDLQWRLPCLWEVQTPKDCRLH
jgi:hypothetical protein